MNPISMVRIISVFAILIVEAVTDLRKRKINLIFPVILAASAIILLFVSKDISIFDAVTGACTGIAIMIVSRLTKGQIGMGDGILLVSTGLMLGWKDNLVMLFFSCLISAVASILILIIKKADKKTEIPFVPFMVPGFLISVFLAAERINLQI